MRIIPQLLLTFLLNAAWQVVVITACAALCDWLLRKTAARYRHALWVSALFLSICVPALSSSRLIKPSVISKPAPVETRSEPVVVSRIVSGDVEPVQAIVPEVQPTIEPARPAVAPFHLSIPQRLATGLIALYLMLLMYRGTNLFRAWRRTRAIIGSAETVDFPGPVQGIIQKCLSSLKVRRVRILSSAVVPVPITVGVLNPLVILPEDLLHEEDRELLTSAVGHELVHVIRRDYLANLVYEFVYLPLSFHPAAALVRRRIKQTRELCCDESVAAKLLTPEIYARSLVRLIGSVPITRRLAANTTIGIAESDNLEVRIMSLLRTPKLAPRRKVFLLLAALLVLAVPCLAASSFAFSLDIAPGLAPNTSPQEPNSASSETRKKLERAKLEQARAELERQARVLKEQMRVTPESQRIAMEKDLRELERALKEFDRQKLQITPDAEARLREAQRNLEENNRVLQEYYQQKQPLNQDDFRRTQDRYAELLRAYPDGEARLKEAREKLVAMQRQTPDLEARKRELEKSFAEMQKSQADRKAKLIYKVEPGYTEQAREKKIEGSVLLGMTIDHDGLPQNIQIKRSLEPSLDQAAVDAVRKWRFLPAIKDGQPVSMWITVEVNFTVEDKQLDQERKERTAVQEREMEEREKQKQAESYARGEGKGKGEGNGNGEGSGGPLEMKRRKDYEQGREERARKQVEMTQGATIGMDRAIQIATSQVPGKVLACSLGRDGDKIFYHLVIITTDGDKSTTTYVWLSATDGQILKTEKEREKREQE
jgi:TonB family protein